MYKIYVSAGLFLALSALKLLAPGKSADIRQQVMQVISREDNYPQMVETLGRKLSQGELAEDILEALGITEAERVLADAKEAVPDAVITFSQESAELTP